jgi:WD40 repeat protein
LKEQKRVITALAFAPDGQSLASCSRDQTVVQWDVKKGQPLYRKELVSRWMSTVAFSADGRLILVGDDHGAVTVFDQQSGEEKQSFARRDHVPAPTDRISALAISPDGKLAAFAFLGYNVEVWDLATKRRLQTLRDSAGVTNTITFSPDSQCVLSGNYNGTFTVWAVQTGGRLRAWRAHTSGVNLLAFSPDGLRIVSTSDGAPYSVNVFER